MVLPALALAASILVSASPARAQERTPGYYPPVVTVPSVLPATPSDFSVSASDAINAANENPQIERLREQRGGADAIPKVTPGQWEILYIVAGKHEALVFVDGDSGEVTDAWTGDAQIAWPMARGYDGQFGHLLNAPYVWIPLALVFFFGLFDFRNWRRMAHLDLLVLLSFGLSFIAFSEAEIGVSAPLVYPPLVYLLARMLWIGFKREGIGLRPSAPVKVLLAAVIILFGARVALNIADSGVIDVGYAGVIGADRIAHGEPLYGEGAFPEDNPRGDTYGPLNYLLYVPFELIFSWDGGWGQVPAAHAAAIFFDLAAIVGLLVLGPRLRPRQSGGRLGVTMAFAWVAYPWTDFALQSNTNDALLAALLIWALVGFSSLGWRALFLAMAAAVKFVPLALVPLFAAGYEGLWGRLRVKTRDRIGGWLPKLRLSQRLAVRLAYFATVLVGVLAVLYIYPAVDPGLATTWDRTIDTQLGREAPFSIWGQVQALQPLQILWMLGVVIFGASLLLVPRRRSLVQVAALSTAVIIAVQLSLEYWFYLYIPWFTGILFAAIAPQPQGRRRRSTARQEARSR
ncbi:MAG: hypothetical protein ACRDL6_00800 [Solirubrobacterales bacterium]